MTVNDPEFVFVRIPPPAIPTAGRNTAQERFRLAAIRNSGTDRDWGKLGSAKTQQSAASKASQVRNSRGPWEGHRWEARVSMAVPGSAAYLHGPFEVWVRHVGPLDASPEADSTDQDEQPLVATQILTEYAEYQRNETPDPSFQVIGATVATVPSAPDEQPDEPDEQDEPRDAPAVLEVADPPGSTWVISEAPDPGDPNEQGVIGETPGPGDEAAMNAAAVAELPPPAVPAARPPVHPPAPTYPDPLAFDPLAYDPLADPFGAKNS